MPLKSNSFVAAAEQVCLYRLYLNTEAYVKNLTYLSIIESCYKTHSMAIITSTPSEEKNRGDRNRGERRDVGKRGRR